MIGSKIDKYTLTKKLGEGGMGAVYIGEHEVLRKKAAIKVLLPHWTREPMIVQRFVNEAIAMGALEHPNIVAVTDAGQLADGSWYIVMEYLDGGTLGAFAQSNGPMSMHLALQILAPVAAGLEAAHKRGIVHRDLKPDNIFLTQRNRNAHFVKILDWGISKLGEMDGGSSTKTGMVAGTPAYMAPEQMENLRGADQRSDVFSLGVIAYQMMTGGWLPFQKPQQPEEFHGLSAIGIHRRVMTETPVDPRQYAPALNDGWANAILAAIHKDPQRRPQSARAFALALASATPGDAYQAAGADVVNAYAPELLEIGNLEETVRAVKPSAASSTPSRYRFGEQLGQGGMAEVFRATQVGAEGFARTVAVKRVLPGFSNVPQFVSMFITEARLASLLEHPNIVSVLDFDRDEDGRLFLAMEYVEGKDVASVSESGRLPFGVTIFIISEALRGLGYAHDLPATNGPRGLVHRDVSPQNVLISWEGAVKVSDFGIAKARDATAATASLMIKGKPQYMSPEQANGEALDGRSDLFAIGIMLWELLTGRRLFEGGTREVLMQVTLGRIAAPTTISPDVPKDLEAITMRLLSVDRSARYLNAAQVIEDLARCADTPRDGRGDLVRLLAARFPEAVASRTSRPRLDSNPNHATPASVATRNDRAPQPTPMPAWPPSTTLGGAASQALAPARGPRRGLLYAMLGLSVLAISGGASYIIAQRRSAPQHVSASSAEPTSQDSLTIKTTPAGATIKVDGHDRGSSPITISVDRARAVTVEAVHEGFAITRRVVTTDRAEQSIDIPLDAVVVPTTAATAVPDAGITALVDAAPDQHAARPVTLSKPASKASSTRPSAPSKDKKPIGATPKGDKRNDTPDPDDVIE